MAYHRINLSTERAYWVSALTNSQIVHAMMTDRSASRQSMFILAERLAAYWRMKASAYSFVPIYNPLDKSQWPELLGWLITIAEQEVSETQFID